MQENKRIRGIRSKMLFLILTATILIFLITLSTISVINRRAALKDAFTLSNTYAMEYANEARLYLEEYMDVARALGSIFEGKNNYPLETRRPAFMNILHDILVDNPHFLAVWTIWEPDAIDGQDSLHILQAGCTHIGSFSSTYYRDMGQIHLENSGTEGPLFQGSYYTVPKATKQETLLDPFSYSYTGNSKDEVLQTNMIIPIIVDQIFHGVVGVDASVEEFENIIAKIKPFGDGYAFILANDGSFVAHPDMSNVGVNFAEFNEELNTEHAIVSEIVVNGQTHSFTWKDKTTDEKFYYSFAPFSIGSSTTPWTLAVVVPYNSILANANRSITISIIIGLLGMVLLAFLLNFVANRISKPLVEISDEMQKLNSADVVKLDEIAQQERNEIGNIATSSHQLIDWINRTGEFAIQIGNENYTHEYELFNENDMLGKSLLEMSDELKKAQEEATARNSENEQRTWAAQGIANINDLIRQNNDDLENLYYSIISTLVKYIEANQGGLFIIEENFKQEKILELKAAYAYNRRKFLKKKLQINEGLIGECVMERQLIHLSEIPENYIEITSGLGNSNPRNLLLVPLIFNEKVFGVVEVASFKAFEKHIIDFVESVGEAIASTISMIKTNVQTSNLLERSQQQAEELETRERELQQNLEELKSVHEQMDNTNKKVEEREKNVIAILDGIMDGIITCNQQGEIIDFNPEFEKFTGYTKELEGKSIGQVIKNINLPSVELNKEHKFAFTLSDDSTKELYVKVSHIKKTDGINYLFLIRTD